VKASQPEEITPPTANQNALFGKLRGAASLQPSTTSSALELLTGSWDKPTGLFVRDSRPSAPHKTGSHAPSVEKKTLYLDEQAEADLHYLLTELARDAGPVNRSEGVRRALHVARLATERRRSLESR
jgi:hypothetical protein